MRRLHGAHALPRNGADFFFLVEFGCSPFSVQFGRLGFLRAHVLS